MQPSEHEGPRSALPVSRRDFVAATGAAVAGSQLAPHLAATLDAGSTPMNSAELADPRSLSLVELAASIREGHTTSVAAVTAYLDRIAAVNPGLNAVVQLRREGALAEAAAADKVPKEKRGRLHGVPITIKDSLETAGLISTGGTKGRASFVPAEDATVVQRLRAAGAILMGKTNTPDLTLAFETNNLVYGRTNNPYDVTRTSGGSSGGAAAIIAAGGSPLDIGSDTGGSIRIPAHFCGIAGHKATSGRVPRTGHIIGPNGPVESLTHIGPLARRVDDLALALSIIAGPDNVDPHIVSAPLGDHRKVQLRGLRVAHFTKLGSLTPTAETAAAVESALRIVEKGGAKLTQVSIPAADDIYAIYSGLFWNDGGAMVSRLLEKYGTKESGLFDRIKAATTESSGDYTLRLERWDEWRASMLRLFADFDVMICPVYTGPAPLHGTFSRPSAAYTQIFDLTGWPSTVVRASTSPEGLPIGVQAVAHSWREDVSLGVARHLESAFPHWPAR